jgi:EB module
VSTSKSSLVKNIHISLMCLYFIIISYHNVIHKKVLEKAVQNVSSVHFLYFFFLFCVTIMISFNFSCAPHHTIIIIIIIAKKLGEHCFYDLTCLHNDENSACVQINHNAICECREGYHVVTHSKPSRRIFCTKGTYDVCIKSQLFNFT